MVTVYKKTGVFCPICCSELRLVEDTYYNDFDGELLKEMEDISVKYWNRKRGKDKVSKKWINIQDFQTWLNLLEGEISGMITLKHNGGYGKNHDTGHTAIINFKNYDSEDVASLVRPFMLGWGEQ